MNRKLPATLALLLILGASACSRDRDDAPATSTPATSQATPPAVPAAPAPATSTAMDSAQGEALAFLVAINEQEVAAAEQARGKHVDDRVLAYADHLHEEHTKNLDETHALATAAGITIKDSAEVGNLRAKGQADLERLAALDDDDYSDAYLHAMVDGHAEALPLIDDRLLPAATDEAVRKHLAATREHVAEHLAAARELLGSPAK